MCESVPRYSSLNKERKLGKKIGSHEFHLRFFQNNEVGSPMYSKIPQNLTHDSGVVSNHSERTTTLRDNPLARFQASDNISAYSTPGETRFSWLEELTGA